MTDLRLSLSGERPGAELSTLFSGVGLIRGEYLLRPYEEYVTVGACRERITAYLLDVARTFAPHPVWYRTTELTTPEANTLRGNDEHIVEADPMKGLRGLRRGLHRPDTYLLELQAVCDAALDAPNLHVLFPYVLDADEFAQGVELLEKVQWPNEFGSMLEIPSAVFDAPRFVSLGATNLMLGFNDLTSLVTGASRAGRDLKTHPAVWEMVGRVRASVPTGFQWGIAGNLSPEVVELARERDVPYVSLHYCELDRLLGVEPSLLPDRHFVELTKIKTRSQIAAAELRDFLSRFDLAAGW